MTQHVATFIGPVSAQAVADRIHGHQIVSTAVDTSDYSIDIKWTDGSTSKVKRNLLVSMAFEEFNY